MNIDAARLEHFLAEAREKAGQLRAIIKLPAREPQAFREKLVLILELIRGVNARAQRLPLPSVCERAERFEAALGGLRDKQTLSGNDFLPLAVKLDDLLSHLAIQGEVITRLREWRVQNGLTSSSSIDATQRSATATGTTIRQPQLRGANASSTTISQPGAATQKTARLSDLSQESLEEMAAFLADMYSKRVSLVVVGLEDVPQRLSPRHREDSRPAHPQRDSPRPRNAGRSRGAGQAGDRHRRRAVRARGSRWLSAQRAGRRPRSRPRQDPRRGRAPGRAHRGRCRQHRSAQARQPHLPPGIHHRQ